MTLFQTAHSNHITFHTGKQGACSPEVGALAPVFEKSATVWMLTKCIWRKARWELHKNIMYCLEQILEATQNSSCTATYLSSQKPFK